MASKDFPFPMAPLQEIKLYHLSLAISLVVRLKAGDCYLQVSYSQMPYIPELMYPHPLHAFVRDALYCVVEPAGSCFQELVCLHQSKPHTHLEDPVQNWCNQQQTTYLILLVWRARLLLCAFMGKAAPLQHSDKLPCYEAAIKHPAEKCWKTDYYFLLRLPTGRGWWWGVLPH